MNYPVSLTYKALGHSMLAALMMVPAVLPAQERPAAIPSNAYPLDYGTGWACSFGYRTEISGCVAIDVPANAYLVDSRIGWKCDRGYAATDNACTRIVVPENAYLSESSSRFE